MSDDDMGDWRNSNATYRGVVRAALVLAGAIFAVAVPLSMFSIATDQPGSGGPLGVAAAAAICLFAGLSADFLAAIVHRAATPLAAMLTGMALRLFPPLIVCLFLAQQGGGREHLAFVVYLLTFYLVTLTLDTWWAVRRLSNTAAPSHSPSR